MGVRIIVDDVGTGSEALRDRDRGPGPLRRSGLAPRPPVLPEELVALLSGSEARA